MESREQKESRMHIITSCDDGLAPYVTVGMTALGIAMKKTPVTFYLFHTRVSQKNIEMLQALSEEFENLDFREIRVPEPERYDALARYGGGWHGEAYYALCAHQLLPETVHRAMYLDAGDTLVVGDIRPYYNYNFQDKALVVTGVKYKDVNGSLELYTRDDLGNRDELPGILWGLFNSGSYVINLDRMRQDGFTMNDYEYLCQVLQKMCGENTERIYLGDQGLLSVAFAGNLRYYAYPRVKSANYMPYNFCLWHFGRMKEKPEYQPAVIHFAGTEFKPWEGSYPVFLERFQQQGKLRSLHGLKLGQAEYFYMWHEYAMLADRMLTRIGW